MISETFPSKDDELFWAVVSYSRWWLSTDAPFLARIAANGGNLNKDIASNIMTNYNVARGFKAKSSPEFACAIDLANKAANGWPERLNDRFGVCAELAAQWKDAGLTRHTQISAATKLMWFLNPKDWTMFDRYAATGMGVSSAKQFYRALQQNGYEAAVSRLSKVILGSEWSSLPAGKVIDFYLMLRGSNGDSNCEAEGYLEALPSAARQSLIRLASSAQSNLGNNFLPAITRKRRNKR